MYSKNDVFNIKGSRYELTNVDEAIYNELGYVLHQVDEIHKPYSDGRRVFQVVYKEHFGTLLGQKIIVVNHQGKTHAGRWFLDRYCDKDFEYLDVTDREEELLKDKYEELLSGYWSKVPVFYPDAIGETV